MIGRSSVGHFLFQWPGLSVPVQREKHERPEEDGKRNSPTRKVGIELRCCWVALTPMTHVSLLCFTVKQSSRLLPVPSLIAQRNVSRQPCPAPLNIRPPLAFPISSLRLTRHHKNYYDDKNTRCQGENPIPLARFHPDTAMLPLPATDI
jgi:hypothetical protein